MSVIIVFTLLVLLCIGLWKSVGYEFGATYLTVTFMSTPWPDLQLSLLQGFSFGTMLAVMWVMLNSNTK